MTLAPIVRAASGGGATEPGHDHLAAGRAQRHPHPGHTEANHTNRAVAARAEVGLAAFAGVLASLGPARKAARLNILEAIATH